MSAMVRDTHQHHVASCSRHVALHLCNDSSPPSPSGRKCNQAHPVGQMDCHRLAQLQRGDTSRTKLKRVQATVGKPWATIVVSAYVPHILASVTSFTLQPWLAPDVVQREQGEHELGTQACTDRPARRLYFRDRGFGTEYERRRKTSVDTSLVLGTEWQKGHGACTLMI